MLFEMYIYQSIGLAFFRLKLSLQLHRTVFSSFLFLFFFSFFLCTEICKLRACFLHGFLDNAIVLGPNGMSLNESVDKQVNHSNWITWTEDPEASIIGACSDSEALNIILIFRNVGMFLVWNLCNPGTRSTGYGITDV